MMVRMVPVRMKTTEMVVGRGQRKDEKINHYRADLDGHLRHRDDVAGLGIFEGDLVLPGDHTGGEGQDDSGHDKKESLEMVPRPARRARSRPAAG